MILTHQQYMEKYKTTNPDKSSFQRHLEVCGIKTKNDKKNRARKYLWGTKNTLGGITWKTLNELKYDHQTKIKQYLSNYAHSFEDEQIGWVFDLIDFAQLNGIHQ